MYSAEEARKIADRSFLVRREAVIKKVNDWMIDLEVEEAIKKASAQGFYETSINIEDCPDIEVFKEIAELAGYHVCSSALTIEMKINWEV